MDIAVVNRSSLLPDNTCRLIARACDLQLQDHVCPSWDRTAAHVLFVGRLMEVPPSCIPICLLDDPDEEGVLGYHKEDGAGAPVGEAFVRPILVHDGGVLSGDLSVAAIVSHEVIEAFIDPSCQLWSDRGDGTLVALEVCDPVHGTTYHVEVEGQQVSVCNFVMPTWFDADEPRKETRYDWLGTLSRPFQLGGMGYVETSERTIQKEVEQSGTIASAAVRPRKRSARRTIVTPC